MRFGVSDSVKEIIRENIIEKGLETVTVDGITYSTEK